MTRAVPEVLRPPCRGRCPDPHVEDSLFRLAGVGGAMRFVADTDSIVAIAGDADPEYARRELVRRYLRCHGPSTSAAFAEWAGMSPADARPSLAGAEPVTIDGTPALAGGVRLLPAFDPWLLGRDRKWLVPDPSARKALWRASGSPGVVLAGGEPVGTWRTSTRGHRLTVRVEPFSRAPDAGTLQDEAGIVGAVLGASGPVEVEVG